MLTLIWITLPWSPKVTFCEVNKSGVLAPLYECQSEIVQELHNEIVSSPDRICVEGENPGVECNEDKVKVTIKGLHVAVYPDDIYQ